MRRYDQKKENRKTYHIVVHQVNLELGTTAPRWMWMGVQKTIGSDFQHHGHHDLLWLHTWP